MELIFCTVYAYIHVFIPPAGFILAVHEDIYYPPNLLLKRSCNSRV